MTHLPRIHCVGRVESAARAARRSEAASLLNAANAATPTVPG